MAGGSKAVMELLLVAGFIVLWFALQKWILPAAGVPT